MSQSFDALLTDKGCGSWLISTSQNNGVHEPYPQHRDTLFLSYQHCLQTTATKKTIVFTSPLYLYKAELASD